MKITKYSRSNILITMVYWNVPKDYAEPMYNYLVYAYEPGGFFTAVLANDWSGAIQRSHPSNNIESLKALNGWINEIMPKQAWGSYKKVSQWINSSEETRRDILEKCKLVYSEEEEVWMALEGKTIQEPILF